VAKIFNLVISARHSVLTTWTLWRHLLYPVSHPLFQRTLKTPIALLPTSCLAWFVPLIGLLACCGIWTLTFQLRFSVAVLLLMALFCFSSIYVALWVVAISGAIARAHERGTYDLLCLAPPGALGANGAICIAVLHRDDALGWIDLVRKLIAGLLLFIFLLTLIATALRQKVLDSISFLQLFLDIAALSVASYVDHVQSVVLGSLVGMLVPVYRRTSVDSRIWAVAVFLTLQAATFLATFLIIIVILPGLHAESSPLLLSLPVFYLTREVFIISLWRVLAYQLNANPAQLSFWP
jgi:hypothetical protein